MRTPSQPTPLRAIAWLGVFAILIFVASFFFQWGYMLYLERTEGPLSKEEWSFLLTDFATSSKGLGTFYLIQVATILPLLLWAAHFPQQHWRDTLALYPVDIKVIGKWLLVWLLMMTVVGYVLYQLGANEELFMEALKQPHWLMLISASLLAPVVEELVFRGYLFKAFRSSRLGFSGTLLLTSALFAAIHAMQYSGFGVAQIFCLALVLGLAREYTGSVVTPIVIHIVQNSLASLMILLQ